jgi:hypothetical protein
MVVRFRHPAMIVFSPATPAGGKPVILFRPIGANELGLIAKSGFRRFPPRLAENPAFSPVAAFDDARRVAELSKTQDKKSGFAGFVIRFEVADDYVQRLAARASGGPAPGEFEVPAGELENLNRHLVGRIEVVRRYFGERFAG